MHRPARVEERVLRRPVGAAEQSVLRAPGARLAGMTDARLDPASAERQQRCLRYRNRTNGPSSRGGPAAYTSLHPSRQSSIADRAPSRCLTSSGRRRPAISGSVSARRRRFPGSAPWPTPRSKRSLTTWRVAGATPASGQPFSLPRRRLGDWLHLHTPASPVSPRARPPFQPRWARQARY
jgi:hypothetical protein